MIYTGIADEAGAAIETQIKATLELGWKHIEARTVQVAGFPAANIHDIPEPAFDQVVDLLNQSQVSVYCFGSTIGNWSKKIEDPFEISLQETARSIARMKRLGTRFIRIMSYAIRPEQDQMEEERFRRMRILTRMFLDAGIQPVHENCMNYGGMGWPFMLRLLENVPGLQVVFDTGNPLFNDDRTKPEPRPKQDPWEFYQHVRSHVTHVHIKDCVWDKSSNNAQYTYPGEGAAQVSRIVGDLLKTGYTGALSIEPHLAVVFHDKSVSSNQENQYRTYVEYGRRLMKLVDAVRN